MNDIEICYVAALAEGLRLINEKALDRGVNLTKFNADALIHFVRVKGDLLVEIYELNPADYTPSENTSLLQPYVRPPRPPRASCSIQDCNDLVWAKGLCKTHYYRNRNIQKRSIRVIKREKHAPSQRARKVVTYIEEQQNQGPSWVLHYRDLERLQYASSTS